MNFNGIHHLTAIPADAPANNRFYTETPGASACQCDFQNRVSLH